MQVYVSKNEKQWGPYEALHIKSLIESGSFDLQDWAWVEGQTEWVPLARVQHLLLAEEADKAAVVHERVEKAKGQWRSKMTTPLPVHGNTRAAAKKAPQKDGSRSVKSAKNRGALVKACLAVGLVLACCGAWFYWGDKAADYNSLIMEAGVVYQADAEEPFAGKAEQRHENGKVIYKAVYEEGLQHGKFVSFYPDGAKQSEGRMNQGQLHGKVVYYHPNGKKKSRYDYDNGKATSRKNWDSNGRTVNRTP